MLGYAGTAHRKKAIKGVIVDESLERLSEEEIVTLLESLHKQNYDYACFNRLGRLSWLRDKDGCDFCKKNHPEWCSAVSLYTGDAVNSARDYMKIFRE